MKHFRPKWLVAAALVAVLFVCVNINAESGAKPTTPSAQSAKPIPLEPNSGADLPEDEDTVPASVLAVETVVVAKAGAADTNVQVKIIPVRDAISKPILYVIRRGLKEANAEGMRAVVLDMETPGGELGVTLEIMEALDKFDGETLVYVNKEAISAGAIISSVTDEIHFAPGGVIGAAAVVSGGGAEVPDTMKQKINSYMNAKVRSFSEGKGHRAEVIKAMMDVDFEFKIGETVIKPKGELLSLTALEASKPYGEKSTPLLSSGTHDTIEALLDAKYGKNRYTTSRMEVTWSEELASWLSMVSPLLMGAGLLLVFIEFKTPGFGLFGISGGLLLALVFFGHHAAGLSGHVPALVFAVGVILVAIELLVAPGTLVAGFTGLTLMMGGLVWSMVDVWPNEMPAFDATTFFHPLLNLTLALAVAALGALGLWKFLPRSWILQRISLAGSGLAPAQFAGVAPERVTELVNTAGREGVAVTALSPSGQVRVDGRRYEAQVALGSLEAGTPIRVVGRKDFCLLVEPLAQPLA
jgi:membrane-bound serine protease (ClpP class)